MPGKSSTGPNRSRSSSRIAPGGCSRSLWCWTSSAGYCSPIRPETECSSSRRFITTGVVIWKRSSWPAWSMWQWVCRTAATSSTATPCAPSAFSSRMSSSTRPRMPSRPMISASRAPVSTRIGPAGLPRIRAPHVWTQIGVPMFRPRTRKLDSTNTSVSERSLISCAGMASKYAPGRAMSTRYSRRMPFESIESLESALRESDYLPDRGLATALYLSLRLEKPLLLEGEAGVGKTEAAKALARTLPARLIRLQCYEGLDVAHAVYEWNYSRQLLHIRAAQEGTVSEAELFGPEYLIRRPLLEAIDTDGPVVLLIDEVDRADEEFEAFLLEVLSDFQITIPEIGTIRARRRPAVVLTSNRTRDLHDALKRRTLYHWIGHPGMERELEIVKLRVPGVPERLAAEAAAFVRGLPGLELAKPPGVAETIDWSHALAALGRQELDAEVVEQTLGSVLKYREDIEAVRDVALARLVEEARATARS